MIKRWKEGGERRWKVKNRKSTPFRRWCDVRDEGRKKREEEVRGQDV